MLYSRQVTASSFFSAIKLLTLLFLFAACRYVKYAQPGKPFVYKTNIKLEGKFSNEEKQDMLVRLENQLDDSMQAKTVTTFRIVPPFFWRKLEKPPVYDTLNVSRSIVFMTSLLNSNGYYTPVITDTVHTDTVHLGSVKKQGKRKQKEQYRATIDFTVRPGKRLVFDSVGIDLQTPDLQQLALQSGNQSLLKKGEPYSKQILANEINRLIDTFRNNGYYKFSKEDLYIEHDTVEAALIDPTLDPFQQADLLEKLKKKREQPTINVVVKQRPVKDSSRITRYYIGNMVVYPDLPSIEDTAIVKTDTTVLRNITFITRSNKFRLPFIANNIFLRPGRLYKQDNYYRTTNRFAQLPAWQYNNIDFEPSETSDSTLDATLRLYPAKKQKLTTSLEASRNTNDIVTATNLFGIGINFELQNRNAFKQSVLSATDLRGGVELGSHFIQTTQASISHTLTFQRFISPVPIKKEWRLKNVQTLLNANASFTDRRSFFTLRSINGFFGYQFTKSKQKFTRGNIPINITKTTLWKPINIEYTTLDKTDSLQKILNTNPSLNLAFRTGLVTGFIGGQLIHTILRQKGNKTNLLRLGVEESGTILGFIKSLDEGDLFRFIKGDVDATHNIDYGRTQLVFHGYAGAGLPYGRQANGYEQTLPFYKAFFAGGPNSMRGWQVRQLGLGSTQYYNDSTYSNLDRFGDIKLEGNIEYRFLLGTVFGIKFRSALFTDIGNIWSRKPIDTTASAQGSDFQINRFYKEFAVDMGTGLRLDFNYFIIRLDWAYKIRDPQRSYAPNRWFYDMRLADGQFQLGINYPF